MFERMSALVWLFCYIGKPNFDHYLMLWQTDETGLIYDPVQMKEMVKHGDQG